jgi:uncharacterized membrane protein YedE/YeeE
MPERSATQEIIVILVTGLVAVVPFVIGMTIGIVWMGVSYFWKKVKG